MFTAVQVAFLIIVTSLVLSAAGICWLAILRPECRRHCAASGTILATLLVLTKIVF
jgi:hypothetical protein